MNDTQVDHSTCNATSCPMIATNNHSTNGEGQWLCFIHFAAEGRDWPRITDELNRLQWLVDIVRRLRAGANLTAAHHQAFVLAQRSDLRKKDHENSRAWMIRLEGVLQQSCKDSMVQA